MSKLPLSSSSSGIRVFSACLLSLLLIMMPFVQLAAATSQRAGGQRREKKEANAAAENVFIDPALPGPVAAPLAPTITATMSDSFADGDGDLKAEPGETLTYSVTISNGGTDATNVQYTNTIDAHTTLVAGSIATQPIAVNDSFNVLGNVRIQVPDGASDLLNNDCDPDPLGGPCTNAGLTISTLAGDSTPGDGFVGASLRSGNVTANATDGSFQYNPPVGYEGPDSFTYTVRDAGPDNIPNNSDDKTDTATVNITVTGMIWFVNSSASACTVVSNNCGRLTQPFSTLAGFDADNGNSGLTNGSDVVAPEAGDNIFLFNGSYVAPVTLENTQKFIGQGATATLQSISGVTVPPHSDALPATNSNPANVTITSANSGIILAQGNTLRGFTVGNTGTLSGDYDIRNTTTSTVGALSISDVVLNGVGGLFRADSGGALTITFDSVSTTNAGSNGIQLNNASGSFTVNGSGTISGVTGTDVVISGGTVSLSCASNITHTSTASMVDISGGHITGTVTFSGTLTATNGTGLQFNNADSTTSYNFNGTTTLSGGDAGIDIVGNSNGTFSFSSGTSINNPSGVAYNEDTSTANVTYLGTITKNNNTSNAVNINAKSGGTTAFGGLITASTTTGGAIDLTNTGGFVNFTGGLTLTTTSGVAFNATGTGATVNVTGTNTVSNTTGTAVNIVDTTIGASNVTFLSINHNGDNTAINLEDTGAGTFNVTGTGTTDGSGGTIENTTNADAIRLNNTDGLVTLKNMIIEDIGSTSGAFNTISGHDGIHGQLVDGGLTLDNMTIRRISDNAVHGATLASNASTDWNGLSIVNGTLIENTNRFHVASVGDANNEGMVRILGIRGTVTVTDSTLQDGAEMLDLFPISGTTTMTVTNNTFHRAYKEFTSGTTASVGGHCIDVTVQSSANAIVNIGHRTNNALDNDFLNCRLGSIRVANDAGATGNVDVMIGQNEFTSNDHSSGITGDFDFPMGGVLIMSRGTNTATFDVVLDSNYFDEITNASGGVGQFSLDMDGGQWNVIAEENTFDTPGNAPWFIRADNNANTGTMNSNVLFQNNNYLQGFFTCPDPSCGGGYTAPGLRSLVDTQNGGNINFTLNGDDLKHHDTSFDPGQTVEVRQLNVPAGGNTGTVCTNFLNNTAADGYSVEHHNAAGTFNVEKGASNSGPCSNCTDAQIADVFDDNGNTGGSNNPATDPPFVNVHNTGDGGGAINIISGTCTQPSISFALFTPEESASKFETSSDFSLQAETENAASRTFDEKLLQVLAPIDDESPDAIMWWKVRRGAARRSFDSPVNNPAPITPPTSSTEPIQWWQFTPLIILPSVESVETTTDTEAKKKKTKKEEIQEPEAPKPDASEETPKDNQANPSVEPVQDKSVQPPAKKPRKTGLERTEQKRDGNEPERNSHHATSDVSREKSKIRESGFRDQSSEARGHHAKAASALSPMVSGETVTVIIGTLRAGDSVTITYQVTVNNPPDLNNPVNPLVVNPPAVATQGSVSYNDGATPQTPVLTDDPSVIGSSNPTETPVDLFDTTTTLASNLNPSNSGDNVTFTATINETPGQTPNPTGTVDFIDTNNGNAVICNDVVVASSAAQCSTAVLTSGTHDIQAVYSGDGNFEGSNSNVVSQVVVACVTNPVVNSAADPGDGVCDGANCTLREAITSTCSGSTITFNTAGVFSTPQSITVSSTLVIARNVTIDGPGAAANAVTVSAGGGNFRVFQVDSPVTTVGINDLTVTGANATGINGGGLLVQSGTVTLTGMLFTGNTVINGDGGGVSVATGATVNLRNSTISGNTAREGGGLQSSGGTFDLLNVTITNNNANGNTGTGACPAAGSLTNASGGGIDTNNNITNVTNTIIAGNTACGLAQDSSGAFTTVSNNVLTGDPRLGALADNGGPTRTHALLFDSPAIEAGDNAAADAAGLTTDQRGTGYPRKADSADPDTIQTVDIGAFELHPSIENIGNQNTNEDTAINFNFNIGDDTGALITGSGGSVTATSSNTTLVPNLNVVVTDPAPPGGGVRNLSITPATNQSGTTTITVTVTATNGRTATDTFDLTVNAQNDNPTITNNTGHTVNEASTGNIIDNAKLKVDDVDNTAAQLTFTVGTAPANGTLKNNGASLSSGGTFTQADIDNNLLTYDHNGGETTSDSFTFTVSDGAGGSIGSTTFNITVTAQNDAPTMGNNTGTTVNEGSTGNVIDSAKLSVNDVDNTAAQLTYTVGTAPANGTLRKSGGALAGGGTFTQQDINNNLLTYDHNGSETTSDSFTFTVSDGAGGSISSTTFNITVTAQNDAPVVTTTVSNLAYTENDPATAVDTGLTVTDSDSANLTGASASITTNFQSGQDVLGWVDNNLADNITLDGTSTAQTIVLTGADTPANYQAALRAVTYQNSSENPSTLTRTVTFTANDGTTTGQATRGIAVNAANDNPTLTTNAGLTVVNAGTGTIDNAKLKVDDVDNTAAQLTFTVGTATTNGTLKKGAATLSAGGTFTQADIDGNQITYTHNGTATTSDSFTFTVSDGAGGSISSTTFNITIGSPNVSIHGAKVAEPSSGTVEMVFTVALATPAGASGASVDFTTADEPPGPGKAVAGTCGAGGDYTTTSGTVNFFTGQQVKTINVPVCSDGLSEPDETFLVNLSNAVNATILNGQATGTITAANPAGEVLISEIRTSGPGGAGDDFVELYNNSNSPKDISGYGLFKKGTDCNVDSPVLIATIPGALGSNTTVIPARAHYLLVGSQYSLANYGGTGAAAGNQTLTSDLETDANVGLFSTADPTSISTLNRVDAVGFGLNVGGTCNLLREGSTLPSVAGNATTQHSFFRKICEWVQGSGCTVPNGTPKDTNNNSVDFWLADTQATDFGGGHQRLGAPGPENSGSPIKRDAPAGSQGINVFLLDTTQAAAANVNRDRNATMVTNGQFGTITLRFRVFNNTGGNVNRLRYRIVDASTRLSALGTADLRALTGVDETLINQVHDPVTCAGATPCTVNVNKTTLEEPPTQTLGGGFNATLSSGTITMGAPLTTSGPTQSILINIRLGVMQTGNFRFYFIVEALP